jgi:prepilin-type N-terminal cleavage/methylation domain-containing protein
MQRHLNNEQGLTLVELIVSIVLLSLILLAISGMYLHINDCYRSGNYMLGLQRQAHNALADITHNLKEAESVTLSDTVGGDGIDDRIDAWLKVDDADGIANLVEADFWMADVDGDGKMDLQRHLRWEDDWGTTTNEITETLIDSTSLDRVHVDSLEFSLNGSKLVTVRLRLRLDFDEQPEGVAALVKEDTDCLGEDCIELYTNVYLRNVDT